jgi:ubiquinone/menaquinone biosynthesis C-methylase UbiE
MLPKSKSGENRHRKHKREMEISLIIKTISNLIKNNPTLKNKNIKILEFGSGSGFQIPYLQKIGSLVVSDIFISDDIKKMKDIDFRECCITNTPFNDSQFDIIFSNHVIEHIQEKHEAFKELKRIGKSDCIYAFSLPTNIWLLLSVPAQYCLKFREIKRLFFSFYNSKAYKPSQDNNVNNNFEKEINTKNLSHKILPCSHGAYENFWDCYSSFKIQEWRQLLIDNGFLIEKIQPLLLYAPSEWPIVSTTTSLNKHNICSSVLFLLKKEPF